MGELKEGGSSEGDPPEILLIEGLEPSIVDLSDSPHVRRSLRKTPFRNHSARVRVSKAKPKSPLLRMAEMKRSGLRGRKSLHPEVRGLGGSDLKRGKLGRGSGLKLLEPIPESDGGVVEQMEGSAVGQGNLGMEEIGLSGDGGSSGMSGSSEVVLADGSLNSCAGIETWKKKGGSYKQVLQRERIPPGDLSDFSLDLIVAQPLQETKFVAEQMLPEVHLGDVLEVDALMPESMMAEEELRLDEDFPPLCKERLKMAKDKAKNKGAFAQNEGSYVEQQTSEGDKTGHGQFGSGMADRNKEGQKPGWGFKAEGSKSNGGRNYKSSLEDGPRSRANDPVCFEPEKIRKIGIIGESSGLPSIHFSGSDTNFLAEKLGHAIVGKFSHSIPSSLHIQKALQGMRFLGEYSWRYINAKHVLIQFKLLADYAKLLSGPNGMPVWFIDRHPMRVFKWTPEFDPFFESPIAAVWCNLIGLPIHLFDKSALFAIGSLLGEPIQVDNATISRTRLSFARLCVEIDISKVPVNEIIIDLQGREIRQAVKWDRVPLYCHDCKHVGHSSEACYANGQKEKPARRDYNFLAEKGKWQGNGRLGDRRGVVEDGKENSSTHEGAHKQNGDREDGTKQIGWVGFSDGLLKDQMDDGVQEQSGWAFQKQGRRGGKAGGGRGRGEDLRRSSSFEQLHEVDGSHGEGGRRGFSPNRSENRFSVLDASRQGNSSKPRYLRMLPNGDFDPEVYEDEKDWDMGDDSDGDSGVGGSRCLDKRGAASEAAELLQEDKNGKKARQMTLGTSSNSLTCL